MNQVRALVGKDLRIHARPIVMHLLGWIFVMRILLQAQHALGFTKGPSLASMVNTASISLGPLLAIYSAQWLIERERGKETFAWIRTLPVSDLHIVVAKFVAMLAVCAITGLGWWIAMQGIDLGLAPWQLASGWLVWWAFAGLALFCQVLFSGRLAAATPGFLFFVATGVALFVARSPDAVARITRFWNDPWAHVGLWLMCAAVEAVAIGATYVLFSSRDAHRLVD